MKLSGEFTDADRKTYTPYIKPMYGHEFKDDAVASTSNFAGGSSFTTSGMKPAKSSGILGLGLDVKMPDNMTFTATYEGEKKSEYISHAGMLQLRMDF